MWGIIVTLDSQTKYSDRYEDPVEELPTLLSEEQKARLNPLFFPPQTWEMFFNKKARTGEFRASAPAAPFVLFGYPWVDGVIYPV